MADKRCLEGFEVIWAAREETDKCQLSRCPCEIVIALDQTQLSKYLKQTLFTSFSTSRINPLELVMRPMFQSLTTTTRTTEISDR